MTLLIGPDEFGSGWSWWITKGEGESHSTGGGEETALPQTTEEWADFAQGHVLDSDFPSQPIWEQAVVKPFGWSQGEGHAPCGIVMEWK